MRICIHKATKHILEMQSAATAGTLIQNAINGGYAEADVEEREVDDAGYAAAKAKDPAWIAEQQAIADKKAAQAAKAQAFLDNLPSWALVDQAVTNISDLPSAKAFIRKLARVVYWDIRDKAD